MARGAGIPGEHAILKNSIEESVELTGCGWVTPFAAGSITQVLEAGGKADSEAPDGQGYWAIPDSLGDDHPHITGEVKRERGALYTAVAFEYARQSALLTSDSYAPERVGLVLGCAMAGQLGMIEFANEVRAQTPRFVSPLHFPQTVGNYISGALARNYDIRGPNSTVACGAASGLLAVIEGCRLVAGGLADVMFAGGVEQLSPHLARGLREPGVRFSEGACLLAIEARGRAAARGTQQLATVVRIAHPGTGKQLLHHAGGVILSGTTHGEPGAILIERWIGRCPGSLGAAAVAAAIGAAAGAEVPVVDPNEPTSTIVKSVAAEGCPPDDKGVTAVVFADTDNGHRTTLEVVLSPPP